VWIGLCSVDVSPSPKSQSQEVGVLVEVSVNCTTSGVVPLVTFALKFASGAAGVEAGVLHSQRRQCRLERSGLQGILERAIRPGGKCVGD